MHWTWLRQGELASAPKLDRLLVPGTSDASVGATADAWASSRGLVAERIHASGDMRMTRHMSTWPGARAKREAGIGLEYPTRGRHLNGLERRLDALATPLAHGLIGLGALIFARHRRRWATV